MKATKKIASGLIPLAICKIFKKSYRLLRAYIRAKFSVARAD